MKFAFVFPGQGSQTVGMLDAWKDHPAVLRVLEQASDALGENVGALIAQGPAEKLNLTTYTQPVMLTAAIACYEAYLAEGGQRPSVVAGHSLGEYSALVAAGALKLEDAVRIVRIRAAAMQNAVPVGTGGMAAILGLTDEAVREACSEAKQDEVVEAVNFNAPAQVVIAGHKDAVTRACEIAKQKGAKRALPLPVSAPFHSSLMKPAAETLAQALAEVEILAPTIPLVNNVDVVTPVTAPEIRDALVRQAYSPVRWVESIQYMKASQVTHIVECGPGKVLAGLVKRIDGELQGLAIYDPATLSQFKELLV